ncbi:hypothetical protein ACFXJ6_08120 [Streptomyces sp. NPDC059218]|uniref:hypothetical protein n=1 Tax=unclassified Streptomyces TaxID=2593676 RepID=UPI00369A5D9D
MTPEEIAARIAAIHEAHPQNAWNRIPPLWREVLGAIASGAPDAQELAAAALRTGKPPQTQPQPLLTPRLVRAVLAARRGDDLVAMSRERGLHPGTMHAYVRESLQKLGARDVAGAVQVLLSHGEITEDDLTG